MIMKNEKPHICEFTRTSKVLDSIYPSNSKFSRIKRRFREFFLISEENGRKCFTRKGNTGYIYEKERHLTQYFYMIHPYSKFCQYWEIFAVIELCLSFIVRLFINSVYSEYLCTIAYQIAALFSDLFEMVDALLLFFVGYIDKETQEVVLERRRIFINYIHKFYFYINLIASSPFEFCIYLYTITIGPPSVVFQYVIFIKIFKIFTFSRYFKHIVKIYNWSDLRKIIIWTILLHLFICHWITCLFHIDIYGVSHTHVILENEYSEISDCLYHHFKLFFIIVSVMFKRNGFFGPNSIENSAEKCIWFITVASIYFVNMILGGLLIQHLALMKTSDVLYEEMKEEVQKFLAQENLPNHIHKKVIKYLEFRYRHTYFFEKIIFEMLSPPLKREVANFFCYNLMVNSQSLFIGIPDDMVSDLCLLMKYEIFLPGDLIFRAGGKADELFFLYSGSVVVYSQKEKEIMHWYEGQQFGSSAFTGNTNHPVTAMALEMSECYILRYSDFLKTAADRPEYIKMVNKAASARRQYILELYAEE